MPKREMPHKSVMVRMAFEKLVQCQYCQCTYRIGKPEEFVGHGQTEEIARLQANARAKEAKGLVPFVPCPSCFRYPKRMVARTQFRQFRILLLLTGILLGCLFFVRLIAIRTGSIPPTESVSAIASGLAALATLACIWLMLRHPDLNRDRNRQQAETELARGAVTVTRPSSPGADGGPAYRAGNRCVVVAALGVVAILLFQSAMIYRVASGWHGNPGLHPMVCGPGDVVRVRFDDNVVTVGPFWRGHVVAKLEDDSNSSPKTISAATNQEFWDPQQIKSKGNSSMPLWADVTIPSEPKLAGTTGRLHLVMDVTFPKPAGPGRFDTAEKHVEKMIDVKFADPGAGVSYREAYFNGALSACVVLLGLLGVLTVIAGLRADTPSPVTIQPVPVVVEDLPESDPPVENPELL
jgi:hypothetical protein